MTYAQRILPVLSRLEKHHGPDISSVLVAFNEQIRAIELWEGAVILSESNPSVERVTFSDDSSLRRVKGVWSE